MKYTVYMRNGTDCAVRAIFTTEQLQVLSEAWTRYCKNQATGGTIGGSFDCYSDSDGERSAKALVDFRSISHIEAIEKV